MLLRPANSPTLHTKSRTRVSGPGRRALAFVVTLSTAGVLTGGVLPGGASAAQRSTAKSKKCVAASISGSFGVKFEGNSKALGRIVSVSVWTFDGKGGFRGSETYNSETSGPMKRTVGGTYKMQADCTFGLLFPSEVAKQHEADGVCVLVDAGKELYCLDNEEGWQALGTGKKI